MKTTLIAILILTSLLKPIEARAEFSTGLIGVGIGIGIIIAEFSHKNDECENSQDDKSGQKE